MKPTEIEIVGPERTAAFRSTHTRDALSAHWNFRVVWHEQTHEIAATRDGDVVGVLGLRIAASLAHVESLVVRADVRMQGVGRALLARAEDMGKYYNAHKMTVQTLAHSASSAFFQACDYKTEAILPQHTWKLDVAIMRKFLL